MSHTRAIPALALAAAAGLVHGGFSLYWGLGGTALLGTLGGRILEAFAGLTRVLVPVGLVKIAAALAPLLLHRHGWPGRPWSRGLGWCAALVLLGWGGANTAVGQLVLAGIIHPDGGVDRLGMIGHAWLWDPLFLVWGAALAGGLVASRRPDQARVTSARRPS